MDKKKLTARDLWDIWSPRPFVLPYGKIIRRLRYGVKFQMPLYGGRLIYIGRDDVIQMSPTVSVSDTGGCHACQATSDRDGVGGIETEGVNVSVGRTETVSSRAKEKW